ncbi:MAG: 4-hydroxy-tetrahydrodipicolinate reductase [Spirochaetes bacterium]|nr:4-hydroxy-tetrahydrodipicolinate reductase [Spirochaetota bacterium]
MMKTVINGAAGRMGTAILRILLERGHSLHAAFEHESSPAIGTAAGKLVQRDDITTRIQTMSPDALAGADIIIDFSSPGATLPLLAAAVAARKPIVIGTTGISDSQKKEIESAAGIIPLIFSPNMSVGVNLLFKLTEMAARILKNSYDIEVFEAHHKLKKDAPSGTAKKLIEIIKSSSPETAALKEVYDRSGIIGERAPGELGVMALRGGDIVGDHTVFFIGQGERIELTHRLNSRDTLALGSVLAAEFLNGRSPGLYTMFDVLGF